MNLNYHLSCRNNIHLSNKKISRDKSCLNEVLGRKVPRDYGFRVRKADINSRRVLIMMSFPEAILLRSGDDSRINLDIVSSNFKIFARYGNVARGTSAAIVPTM